MRRVGEGDASENRHFQIRLSSTGKDFDQGKPTRVKRFSDTDSGDFDPVVFL